MVDDFVSSDLTILDLLRKRESLTVTQLATTMQVTATAVRQRLTRLMAQGYIERTSTRRGRGRPSHRYILTDKGRRKAGSNFADLAVALWEEICSIEDREVRLGLLGRLAKRLAHMYADRVHGHSLVERMEQLAELFAERRIPLDVDEHSLLPVLTAEACPYPELAEQDRSICAMERLLFSELLGREVQLSKCRLDGEACCTFESN